MKMPRFKILKKKTPLLGLTILQLFILFIVINGGTVALVLSQRPPQPTITNTPSYDADTAANTQSVDSVLPENKPNSSGTQNSTTNRTSAATSNLPDKYGCIPQTSGYESCVAYAKKNALTLWCSEQSKKAGDTYYPASIKAKAAYDAVMAEWNAVKDQPYYTHHPYEQYAADAKTKYNAIIKPAYASYVSAINSLNTQGCTAILTYSDTSWAGY